MAQLNDLSDMEMAFLLFAVEKVGAHMALLLSSGKKMFAPFLASGLH